MDLWETAGLFFCLPDIKNEVEGKIENKHRK